MIEFRGPAIRLKDEDLPRVGATIGVGEDEIHTVLDVESAGSGFDALGRPKMLFEPHLFYRNVPVAKRAEAVRLGIAYQQWKTRPYPKDSYPALIAAIALDETAALKSASWGLGQVLGSNHIAAGYPTVQAMVKAMVASEGNQLAAMISFVKAAGLAVYLKLHQFAMFAKGYNGPGYKQNGYDTRLAQRYDVWSRIPNTPWRAGIIGVPVALPWRTDGDVLIGKPEPSLLFAPPPPDVPPVDGKPSAQAPTIPAAQQKGLFALIAAWGLGVYAWALSHPWEVAGGTLAVALLIILIFKYHHDKRMP